MLSHTFTKSTLSKLRLLTSATISSTMLAVLLALGHVTVTIAQSPLGLQVLAALQVGVFDPNRGAVSMLITGGTGPYHVSLDGGTPITVTSDYENTFIFLGGHSFVIVDSATPTPATINVSYVMTSNLTTPPGVGITNIAFTPATTNCSNDGALVITAVGGSGTFNYSLNGGTPQASNTFLNLPAPANYSITVTDATNPSNHDEATVPLAVSTDCIYRFGLQTVNPSCAAITPLPNDGSITVLSPALQGIPGAVFSYILNSGTPQSSPVFANLGTGSYSVQIQADGCLPSPQQIVVLARATGPNACGVTNTITATPNAVGCFGTITVNAPSLSPSGSVIFTNPATGQQCCAAGNCPGLESCANQMADQWNCCYSDPTLSCNGSAQALDGVVPTQLFEVITLGGGLIPTTALDIKKCVKGKIRPGKEATFRITVTNTGNSTANDVKVTDILPCNLTFLKGKSCDAWTFTAQGQTVTAVLPSLAMGASSTFTLKVKGTRTVTNEATVEAPGAAPVSATACAKLN